MNVKWLSVYVIPAHEIFYSTGIEDVEKNFDSLPIFSIDFKIAPNLTDKNAADSSILQYLHIFLVV